MRILPITVLPKLPERLEALIGLSRNLWFAWNMSAVQLFRRISSDLWETSGHNPVKMLGQLDQARVEELLNDEGFLDHLDKVSEEFDHYMSVAPAYSHKLDKPADYKVAYLSAEYGLAECLQIYSGGLGVLSGDHLKSASDLRVPLVACGLFYKEGYFQQYLNIEGWQQEKYPDVNFYELPAEQLRDESGEPKSISVKIEDRDVTVHIWRVQVGRVPLYLMDTNVPSNSEEDRGITKQLYGGDRETRIKQEIVLGIGGVRMLKALGIEPAAYHMNEGHSAFAGLERIRQLLDQGISYDQAFEFVRVSNIFTTHTPVPAGNDSFEPELMKRFIAQYADAIGLNFDDLLSLGRIDPSDNSELFGMTVIALKMAVWSNGVSRLHGHVARDMWKKMWPEIPHDDLSIKPLTNGVHIPSWISNEMSQLYDRYLGPRWHEDPDSEKVWARASTIPDTQLWRTHVRRRERLVAFSRERLAAQLKRQGSAHVDIAVARGILNSEALTIGFARRFATYKRAVLFFSDLDRLDKLMNDPDRPVQMIIAGKAHPKDDQGKEFIKKIVEITRDPRFRHSVVFIENYDMNVARYLVSGVDVWLNNPRRPLEACGTSGMKASANGALNFSILDGWWDEAYDGKNGWAIGSREVYDDEDYQDEMDALAIYELLEKEIVPMFYNRGPDRLPSEWIERMKHNLKTVCPEFNAHRMVEDYMVNFYDKAAKANQALSADSFAELKKLESSLTRAQENWEKVKVLNFTTNADKQVHVYDELSVRAEVDLAGLKPEDVNVEVIFGRLNPHGEIKEQKTVDITSNGEANGSTIFEGSFDCSVTGRMGIALRVTPSAEGLVNPGHLNLIKWG